MASGCGAASPGESEAKRFRGGGVTRVAAAALVALLALAAVGEEARDEMREAAYELWVEIKDTEDPALLTAFIETFPDSPFVHVARARLERLEDATVAPAPAPVRKRRRSR